MHKLLQNPTHSHKERLLKLSEKISEVRVYTEQEKNSKLKGIEQTIKFIEDNIFECQEAFNKTLKNLEDNIVHLQQEADEDKKEADLMISSDVQDLMKFEQKLKEAYDTICQRRREHESRVNHTLDEQVAALSADLQAESAIRQESIKQLTQVYQSDIKKLQSSLHQEKSDREDEDEKIQNFMHSNLGKLVDDVNDLQKYSENSEKTMFNTIKTSVVEVKSMLDTEKHTRETTHEHMIKLLEDSYKNFKTQEF